MDAQVDYGVLHTIARSRRQSITWITLPNIDHTRSKAKSPQTNGIVEQFHKTLLNEFYRIIFRKKIYTHLADLQADLNAWLREYNEERVHQGRWCYGRTRCKPSLTPFPWPRRSC